VLTLVLPRDVQEIDPRFSGDAYGHKLSRLLFASLVTIDPISLEPVPDLAESVQIEAPTRYRVRLRRGLRFSDGSALDATDVVATFRGVVDPAFGSRYAQTYRRIRSARALDSHTVLFELTGPHATFMTDLELPVMRAEDALSHVGTLGTPPPVGSGPYVLQSRAAGRIELAANPHWHGGVPLHPRVRMVVIRDDNTRALRMRAGAGDLALNAIPPLLIPLFEGDDRFTVDSAAGIGTTYVGLNLEAQKLRDRRVRAALAHAIDRSLLIETKLGGRAREASSWIVPGHWAYWQQTPRYPFDLKRAAALLDAAGYPPDADGVRMRLAMRCGSDRFRQSIARAIGAMLGEVGVEVDIRPTEIATLLHDLGRGQFELTMLQVPEVVEPHVLSWFFGSDKVPGEGREGANRWRLRSAALDAALERGRRTTVRQERIEAYRDAQRVLATELPVIPLWHEDVVAVKSRRARDFVVPRLGRFGTLAR
jgi:peptide/nickel transport system substrate-binding protein